MSMKSNSVDGSMSNAISHPEHYNQEIQPIDYVEAQGLDHHCATAVVYISRAGKKEDQPEVKDLGKAIWYLVRRAKLLGYDITVEADGEVTLYEG